jgi:tRNA(Ile)-lysidine synthase
MPSKDLLDELLRQVLTAKKDATIKIYLSKDLKFVAIKMRFISFQKNQKTKKL